MTKDAITRRAALDQCELLMREAATLRVRIRNLVVRGIELERALAKAKAKPKPKPMRRAKRKAVRK